MFNLDMNTEFGIHVAKRLQEDEVIWLTTVRPDGIPQPNPVWFLWEGDTLTIYSQPGAHKVSHIQSHPQVALNFNTTPDGGDVVIFTGEAQIDPAPTSVNANLAYLKKYAQGIHDINSTPDAMARDYSAVIKVTLKHVRGML
jgi:PPOX class probable F420-dependent enzyme